MSAEKVFHRCQTNPVLSPEDLSFRALAVLNPGAAEVDGEVILLPRAESADGFSDIYVARSRNGVDGWRIEGEPILAHGQEGWSYESWGCEDARATYLAEDGCWYITYVAYSEMGPAVGIARTGDFARAERISLIGATNDKDGVLLGRKFDGRYAVLHRPDAGGYQHIWSAYSPDLEHWGEPHCVLREGAGPEWDAVKVGAGPPPIALDAGWLLTYHGVKRYGGGLLYRVGLALLDAKLPHKAVARSPGSVFQAAAPYELSGAVPNVVFPTGALLRGEELWMYYGAADRCVALATAKLGDVMGELEPSPQAGG